MELRRGVVDGGLGDAVAEPRTSKLSALCEAGDARSDEDHLGALGILGLLKQRYCGLDQRNNAEEVDFHVPVDILEVGF